MNGYQISIVLFAASVIAISAWSIAVVIRSPRFRSKPVWIIGCLVGVVGLGIDWTTPDDLILLLGISIPVVMISKVIVSQQVIVKTGFPIVSIIALIRAGGRDPN